MYLIKLVKTGKFVQPSSGPLVTARRFTKLQTADLVVVRHPWMDRAGAQVIFELATTNVDPVAAAMVNLEQLLDAVGRVTPEARRLAEELRERLAGLAPFHRRSSAEVT